MNIYEIESIINYKFQKPELLGQAFVHSSFVNEQQLDALDNNERLEFLGDAVLSIIVSDYIYKEFPDLTEGELTRLRASVVCEASLSKQARNMNLGKFLQMGKGETSSGGANRDSILCDLYESVLGAIYLDGGYKQACIYVMNSLKAEIHSMKGLDWIADPKTHLQEQLQKTSSEPIEYNVIHESGPAHSKLFKVQLSQSGKLLGEGEGKNKKEAEQNAARNAIEKYKLF